MTEHTSLRLRVLVPERLLLDIPVLQLVADTVDGSWCIKPRHIDFVTALQRGILVYKDERNMEAFIALNEGLLIKCDKDVTITTQDAIRGDKLEELRHNVAMKYREDDEQQKLARTALVRLESGAIRRLTELEKSRYE